MLLAAFLGSLDVIFGDDLRLTVQKSRRTASYSIQTFECSLKECEASISTHFLVVVPSPEEAPQIRLEGSFQMSIADGCDFVQSALCQAIVAHETYMRNAFTALLTTKAEKVKLI